jgi:hypothetical protein
MRLSPQLKEASLTLLECVDMSPANVLPRSGTLFVYARCCRAWACSKSPLLGAGRRSPSPRYLALEDGVLLTIRLKEATK